MRRLQVPPKAPWAALRVAVLLALSVSSSSCAGRPDPMRVERAARPPGGVSVDTIAVAPFVAAAWIERPGAQVTDVEAGGIEMVTARVLGALLAVEGLEVAPPEETARWLEANGYTSEVDDARVEGELARSFGADAVLRGKVRRYLKRIGGERGAQRPAAVWFELELRLPDGTRLWRGSWDERQVAFSEDLFSTGRAIERGFAWVDAPRLVSDGVRALVADLLAERERWR